MELAGPREYHTGSNTRDFQGVICVTLVDYDKCLGEDFFGGKEVESETQRNFDIIVYGATGFTGALVAEYLHEAHSDTKWLSQADHKINSMQSSGG